VRRHLLSPRGLGGRREPQLSAPESPREALSTFLEASLLSPEAEEDRRAMGRRRRGVTRGLGEPALQLGVRSEPSGLCSLSARRRVSALSAEARSA